MAPTAFASGTASPVVGTELFLTNINVAGVFVLVADLINMASLDIVEFRVYQMVLTGGTPRVTEKTSRVDAQIADDLILRSVPYPNELTDAQSLRFSLKQIAGTARTFPWKVLQL